MSVISIVSPKGGTGKTTTSLLIAGEVADAKGHCSLIDADPNQPLTVWSKQTGRRKYIRVVGDISEDTIIDTIDEEAARSAFVVVDLEGTQNMMVSYAVSKSDLVIIPCQGSPLDAMEAMKAVKLVRMAEKGFRVKVPHVVLFTRTSPAIQTRTFKFIQDELASAKVPTMSVQVIEREAYRAMFSFGGTIHELKDADVSGLDKARDNAAALIEEIAGVLSKGELAVDAATVKRANAA
jgi:chromosome partitioning protein